MLNTILIIAVIAVAAVLLYAATRPDSFQIQRSVKIAAPPEKVFPLINDFRNWQAWSPWEKKDPAMKKTHSGASQGKGAVLEWDGNKDVGTGRMEALESIPSAKIIIKLDFLKPFEAHNTAEFNVSSAGNVTDVTWAMYGAQPYMMKVMGLMCSMDKMVGKDFETGLANLKQLAEK
jgi:Polyketide cyclase / dehydrase and lipid transport